MSNSAICSSTKDGIPFYSYTDLNTSDILTILRGTVRGGAFVFEVLSEKLVLPKDAIVIRTSVCGDAMLFTDRKYFVYQFRDGNKIQLFAFLGEDHLRDQILTCLDHLQVVEKRAFEPDNKIDLPSLAGLKR